MRPSAPCTYLFSLWHVAQGLRRGLNGHKPPQFPCIGDESEVSRRRGARYGRNTLTSTGFEQYPTVDLSLVDRTKSLLYIISCLRLKKIDFPFQSLIYTANYRSIQGHLQTSRCNLNVVRAIILLPPLMLSTSPFV